MKYIRNNLIMNSEEIKPYKGQESKKVQVAAMFNNIANTYDFLNHFLSFGIDILWRKKAIRELRKDNPKVILDVATGTGDFALEALSLQPDKIIGVDISEGMLAMAREKIQKRKLENQFNVQLGDSENLPFQDNTFDAVTVSFGVRNFEHLERGLENIYRVLKPNGKTVILEFSKPRYFPFKQLYNFYFNQILPVWGRVFSKDHRAYTYLTESVASFPNGKAFLQIMQESGFKSVTWKSLGWGICAIYTGLK